MNNNNNNIRQQQYVIRKSFLSSFKELLDLRGARYLMSNANPDTFISHNGNNEGAWNLNENYQHMMDTKDEYNKDIENEDFPEALKQDARTQLAIIDDIEQKFKNAGYQPSSGGRGRRKRKQTKRRTNKRKRTKRKSNKRKRTKRKH